MVLENLLNPVFSPLLELPTQWAVIILSFLISLGITLIYKLTTNQNLMKQLKAEMKEFQKEIKELKHDPKKAMEIQKKSMQTNLKYMSHSMRSTLFTLIPIIIIFGWMSSNLAFESILPGQEFTTTVTLEENVNGFIELKAPDGITIDGYAKKEIKGNKVKWVLSGEEGEYLLEYSFNNEKFVKELLISNKGYKEPIEKIKRSVIKTIEVEHKPKKLLNLFGWKIGWLGTYIIFSLIFSMSLRKIFKVY